jgi:acyl-CoA thioesterase-1
VNNFNAVAVNCIELFMVRTFFSLIFISIIAFLTACGVQNGVVIDVDSRPLVPPKETLASPKIIAFGDSLTAGFGLEEIESYPYLLQQRLKADGFDYEVVNAGVSGDTSLGGLERIDWTLESENAEVLILELGANDLLRGVPPGKMKENLDKIIEKAKAKNVDVLLCGMIAPPTMGAEYQRAFSDAFPDLAEKHDVEYVPFLLDGVALNSDLNQADGIHPNAQGTRMMMENVYRELKPLLTK